MTWSVPSWKRSSAFAEEKVKRGGSFGKKFAPEGSFTSRTTSPVPGSRKESVEMASGDHSYLRARTSARAFGPPGVSRTRALWLAISENTPSRFQSCSPFVPTAAMPVSPKGSRWENCAPGKGTRRTARARRRNTAARSARHSLMRRGPRLCSKSSRTSSALL